MPQAALVLSGGGAKGAFQVSAERYAREHHGYEWTRVAGVSVGALNAAMIGQRKYQELAAIWNRIGQKDVYRGSVVGGLLFRVLLGHKRSIFDLAPLAALIERHVNQQAFVVPTTVGVTSLASGKYLQVSNGRPDFKQAVLASATMPILWEPVGGVADGPDGVDGGLRNISPLKDVIDAGAETIVAINCHTADPPPAVPDDIVKTALRSLEIMLNEIFRNDLEACDRANRLVTQARQAGATLRRSGGEPYRRVDLKVIQPMTPLPDMLDFSRRALDQSLQAGLERARAVLG